MGPTTLYSDTFLKNMEILQGTFYTIWSYTVAAFSFQTDGDSQ
jgi:hypothetical protein